MHDHDHADDHGDDRQVLLEHAAQWQAEQAEDPEHGDEPGGHQCAGGQCPAQPGEAGGVLVGGDDHGEVAGQHGEAARVDRGEHARTEGEGEFVTHQVRAPMRASSSSLSSWSVSISMVPSELMKA